MMKSLELFDEMTRVKQNDAYSKFKKSISVWTGMI